MQDMALRRKTSFVTFALRGRAENVLDLRSASALREFAKIIAAFELSPDTRKFARKVNLPLRALMRTAREVHQRILTAPAEWRAEPNSFGIPAPNQIFSRYVRAAGFEAVLYPSQQGGTLCSLCIPRTWEAAGHGSKLLEVCPLRRVTSSWIRIIAAWRTKSEIQVQAPLRQSASTADNHTRRRVASSACVECSWNCGANAASVNFASGDFGLTQSVFLAAISVANDPRIARGDLHFQSIIRLRRKRR